MEDRRALSGGIDHAVARLFEARGLEPRQLIGVVVADGPGSFTGLRIGIAFAKGMARALGVPLLSAPSLLAAARNVALPGETVEVRYDALRGDVFRAVYRFDGGGAHAVLLPALARGDLPGHSPGARTAGEHNVSARSLLSLVGVPGGATPVADAASWEPDYGRLAEAEARYRTRHGIGQDSAPAH